MAGDREEDPTFHQPGDQGVAPRDVDASEAHVDRGAFVL